jgi:hypothetical protein
MDKWTVTVVVFVAIIVHQGLNHQAIEFPANQETPILSPALLEAVRILDADLHTHQEPPSSVDQPIGQDATDKVQSDVQSAPFIPVLDSPRPPVRRVRADQYWSPVNLCLTDTVPGNFIT